jgi:hypothetical protein
MEQQEPSRIENREGCGAICEREEAVLSKKAEGDRK